MNRASASTKRLRLTLSIIGSGTALITAAVLAASATTATGTPPSAGAVNTLLNRATLDYRVHSNRSGLEFKNQRPVDVLQVSTVAPAGYSSGWHSHPGLVIVSIQSGSLIFYDEDCTSTTYKAGQVFVEEPGVVGLAKAGPTESRWLTTMLLPVGAPSRIEESAPCEL